MNKVLISLTIEKIRKDIGISEATFSKLLLLAPKLYYHRKHINQKSGKIRKIQIPYPALKKIQRKILNKFLIFIPVHSRIFGTPGTSIKDAVGDHVQRELVITIDIRDFFPSVPAKKIARSFIDHGANQQVAKILTRLVTHKNLLPQGAPTSPCIGRIILTPFAYDMEQLINSYAGATFSIYFDDITLSGPKGIIKIIDDVYLLLHQHSFEAKESKTHIMDRTKDQISLNVRLNERIEATDKFLREIEELSKKVPLSDPSLKGKIGFRDFLERPD